LNFLLGFLSSLIAFLLVEVGMWLAPKARNGTILLLFLNVDIYRGKMYLGSGQNRKSLGPTIVWVIVLSVVIGGGAMVISSLLL
jgi:hypothetical protein